MEAAISALAERPHGVVALGQLQFLGLGRAAVAKRARTGGLHRIHRGVYAVRHPPHRPWPLDPSPRLRHERPGLRAGPKRNRGPYEPHAQRRRRGQSRRIPCTRPARTLVDLGDVANRRAVQRAVDQAEVLRLFGLRAAEEALGRAGRRRGVSVLGVVLSDYTGPALTSQEFKERFLGFCRAASLPEPEVNAWISLEDGVAYKTDLLWREEGLVAETDG